MENTGKMSHVKLISNLMGNVNKTFSNVVRRRYRNRKKRKRLDETSSPWCNVRLANPERRTAWSARSAPRLRSNSPGSRTWDGPVRTWVYPERNHRQFGLTESWIRTASFGILSKPKLESVIISSNWNSRCRRISSKFIVTRTYRGH